MNEKWEYKVSVMSIALTEPDEMEMLNAIGAQGWELATSTYLLDFVPRAIKYVFKRKGIR